MYNETLRDGLSKYLYENVIRLTVRELAQRVGLDADFVLANLDHCLANPGAISEIVERYNGTGTPAYLHHLYEAAHIVYDEARRYFYNTPHAGRQALLDNIPSADLLKFKLQNQFVFRYLETVEQDALAEYRKAGQLLPLLQEALAQVQQVVAEKAPIGSLIQEAVREAVEEVSSKHLARMRQFETQLNTIKASVNEQDRLVSETKEHVDICTQTLETDLKKQLESIKNSIHADIEVWKGYTQDLQGQLQDRPSQKDVDRKLEKHRSRFQLEKDAAATFQHHLEDELGKVQVEMSMLRTQAWLSPDDLDERIEAKLRDHATFMHEATRELAQLAERIQTLGARQAQKEAAIERWKEQAAALQEQIEKIQESRYGKEDIDKAIEEYTKMPLDDLRQDVNQLQEANTFEMDRLLKQLDVLKQRLVAIEAEAEQLKRNVWEQDASSEAASLDFGNTDAPDPEKALPVDLGARDASTNAPEPEQAPEQVASAAEPSNSTVPGSLQHIKISEVDDPVPAGESGHEAAELETGETTVYADGDEVNEKLKKAAARVVRRAIGNKWDKEKTEKYVEEKRPELKPLIDQAWEENHTEQ